MDVIKDEYKSKQDLIKDLALLRKRIAALEASAARLREQQEESNQREISFCVAADLAYEWEFWIGPDKRMRFTSLSAKRITGYDAYEYMQDQDLLTRIVFPDDRALVEHHLKEESSHNEMVVLNFRIVTKSGAVRWIKHVCQPVHDHEGTFQGRRSTNRDVTERKAKEEMLKERESQLREVFDSAKDAFLVFDLKGNIVEANKQACRMYGYTHEELTTLSGKDIVDPQYQKLFKQFIKATARDGEFQAESRDVKKDGASIVIEVRGTQFDYIGKKHILAVLRDITERKLAEEELRDSEERFRQLAENINEVFWLISSEENKTVYVSPAYEKMWGRPLSGLYRMPKSFLKSVHPSDRERVSRIQKANIQKGYDIQYRIMRPDGSIRWIRDRSFPIRNSAGNVYRIAGIAEDFTERKEIEESICRYQAQLRSLASELSLAEEKERRRIAVWLHDYVGQNLAVTRFKLGSLRQELPGDDARKMLDDVRQVIEETVRSIRSLTFDLSPPILYEFGLEPALEWLAERFQAQHRIPCAFEDRKRTALQLREDVKVILFQAVRELLLNVAKHSQASRVKVVVQSEEASFQITVDDNGIGFDDTPPADKKSQPAGFGLFSIRERIMAIGGTLSVETQRGRGTRVVLHAPRKRLGRR